LGFQTQEGSLCFGLLTGHILLFSIAFFPPSKTILALHGCEKLKNGVAGVGQCSAVSVALRARLFHRMNHSERAGSLDGPSGPVARLAVRPKILKANLGHDDCSKQKPPSDE